MYPKYQTSPLPQISFLQETHPDVAFSQRSNPDVVPLPEKDPNVALAVN
jgi:hypothetical protein